MCLSLCLCVCAIEMILLTKAIDWSSIPSYNSLSLSHIPLLLCVFFSRFLFHILRLTESLSIIDPSRCFICLFRTAHLDCFATKTKFNKQFSMFIVFTCVKCFNIHCDYVRAPSTCTNSSENRFVSLNFGRMNESKKKPN